MALMTPEQETEWMENDRRQQREATALWRRCLIELVVNRGITPMVSPRNRLKRL